MKQAKLLVDRKFSVGEMTKNHYGIFMENCQGTYDVMCNPQSDKLDEHGFRQDIIDYYKKNEPGFVRYPGGNYTSNYHWKDGVGPRDKRPVRIVNLEMARDGKVETNPIGIDEITHYLKAIGADYMLTVNLSQTASVREVMEEVEYCLVEKGTTLSDFRRANGYDKPHKIAYWCLGNEIDGSWQMGQHNAESYALMARETAKMIKMLDPSAQVVLCGSSNPWTGYYPEWDRIVMDYCYEYVDYLSIHYIRSYNNKMALGAPVAGVMEPKLFLTDVGYMPVDLENFYNTCVAAADFIKGKHLSDKRMKICFDEWVSFGNPTVDSTGFPWKERVEFTPEERRQIMEAGIENRIIDRHIRLTLLDALVSSGYLITFMRNCDRIALACRWQRPIIVKDQLISTTLNHVLNLCARYGKGQSLRQIADIPTYETGHYGAVPSLQTAAIYDETEGVVNVFALNIDLYDDVALENTLSSFEKAELFEHIQLNDSEPLAGNTLLCPDRITPKHLPVGSRAGQIVLPKLSFNILRYRVR